MIKEIRYGGCTTTPSDYESPDGDLAIGLNLIPEEGGLQPVESPLKIASFVIGGSHYRVVLIHKVPNRTHYILKGEITPSLYWLNKADIPENGQIQASSIHLLGVVPELWDMAIMGNTIAVSLPSGMRYFLWSHDKYVALGSKPPFITIEFGLRKDGRFSGRSSVKIDRDKEVENDHVMSDSEMETVKNHLYGLILSEGARATKQGRFWQPFMIRYAYRLFDGSYSWHSSPVLMLPVVHPPVIGASGSIRHLPADITSDVAFNSVFNLFYRIRSFSGAEFKEWGDIIKGVDIFVTPPIYTFDQESDAISCTREFASVYAPVGEKDADGLNLYPSRPGLGEASVTTSRANGGITGGSSTTSYYFDGHYADGGMSFSDVVVSVDPTGLIALYGERRYTYEYAWKIPANGKFHQQVRDSANFYKVASLEFDEISSMLDFKQLTVDSLVNLETLERLPDEYDSHASFVGKRLFAFNNRLSLGNLSFTPATPLPLNSMVQFNGSSSASSSDSARITVWSRRNGVKIQTLPGDSSIIGLDSVFPRYLYHPDHDAYKIKIENLSSGKSWVLPLRPHDFLNGAYYYNSSLELSALPHQTLTEDYDALLSPSVPLSNRVYTSEVDNPFYYPATNRISVGHGSILGMSAAAKALSQGQFGQFPLYAFTSEGVWALEVSSTGTYSARQPITRDVCVNPESITQIDTAVLFASGRGIMLLSGSSSVCLSDNLNIDDAVSMSDLPHLSEIIELTKIPEECFKPIPFEFVSGCGMIYDYERQRILVYNPEVAYGYIYSLKTKKWGMMENLLTSGVNSYPEALAMDKEGNLVDCSKSGAEVTNGLVLTRPLKLDYPDVLKTVNTVIQRGLFKKSHVSGAIYASRSMFDWRLIASSKDHYLRGFRGTPYKYFILALPCSLSEGETLVGCTVQYDPRMINQPR